jgi:hypothetical protein
VARLAGYRRESLAWHFEKVRQCGIASSDCRTHSRNRLAYDQSLFVIEGSAIVRDNQRGAIPWEANGLTAR